MRGYDYIVIGAGSAGCAVAGRLSADSSRSVLLLEAGGSDRRVSVRAPLAFATQFGGPTDWKLQTEPEPGCADRRMEQPRGKVVGGTSSMNAMVWVRGSRQDYDGWGVPGWEWEDVEPVFRRIESGPVHVSRVAEPDEVARRFVAAARAAGLASNDDLSGPDLDGAAISPVTVWRGRRWSAARAYLDPARRRKNLTVVTGALARRVVIREGSVVGIEYEHRGRRRYAPVRGEIVISAGAFGTPHLLQLSGIGPAEHLRDIGITPVLDSPRVGAGLADHLSTFMNWELAPGFVGLSDAQHPKWLMRWLLFRDGKLTSNFMEAVAHIRSAPELAAPDFQLIHGPAYLWDYGRAQHPRPAIVILQSHWTPQSRGTVLARSADPRVPPAIRTNGLTARVDIAAFLRAIRRTRDIAATEPLASVLSTEIHPGTHVVSDAALEKWIRETANSTGHPACTAAMGTDPDSVLDERLRVRGVNGLRVADASALP
jgi:choline dehydrogenase